MTTAQHDRLTVELRPHQNRYELLLDESVVGFATYWLNDNVVTLPHVETNREHRGKDFAAQLMSGILADVRERHQTVRPLCAYAAAYMRRHPETGDLLAN
ncbi:GNAT family N-acetyltransferase [Ilumatobacter sp.]|uniref:GNAT family N-acetyltransferase n=1 Tax=Ilumatobacter sp. TaxID=1967498 RepID=UPI0037511EE6